MKKIKIIFILLILGFVGCKSDIGKITEVNKHIVFPGVPNGKVYIKYSAEMELYKPVKIISVSIVNKEKSFPIEDYSVIDRKNKKIYKKELQPGNYYFDADLIHSDELEKANDFLEIIVKSDNKTKVFKIAVTKGPAIIRK
jgi:hypothetical protein